MTDEELQAKREAFAARNIAEAARWEKSALKWKDATSRAGRFVYGEYLNNAAECRASAERIMANDKFARAVFS